MTTSANISIVKRTYEAISIIIASFYFKLIGSRAVIKTDVLEVDKVLQDYL